MFRIVNLFDLPVRRGGFLILLLLAGFLAGRAWSQTWKSVCAQQGPLQPSNPPPPLPRQGIWELRAFRQTETFELRLSECGERLLPGGAAYEHRSRVHWVELDRQPDGAYIGSKEGIIRWEVTPESEELITGHMVVVGRPEPVAMRFVEPVALWKEVKAWACECQAVQEEMDYLRSARDDYAQGLQEAQQGQVSTSAELDKKVNESLEKGGDVVVTAGWKTNARSCEITEGDLTDYPTRRSFEVIWTAGYVHEQVHRDRCCRMNRENEKQTILLSNNIPPTYNEWSLDPENQAQDEIEGYDAAIPILQRWLEENCR